MEPSAGSVVALWPLGDRDCEPERLRASTLGLRAAGDEERDTDRMRRKIDQGGECGVVVEWSNPKLM